MPAPNLVLPSTKVMAPGLDTVRFLCGNYWAELRVFLSVAKTKSFSGAATELGSSVATVGRDVRRLETVMGAVLLVASKKGVALTRKGETLAAALTMIHEHLSGLARDLGAESREAEGHVSISCTEALAGLFIVPAMPSFRDHFPRIKFTIRNPVNLQNFGDNKSDIMVAVAPIAGDGLEARHVGWVHLIPVASHSYVAQHGMPDRNNLAKHLFLDTSYYSGREAVWAPWQEVVRGGELAGVCDNSYAYALQVKAGLGIGLLGNFTLADESVLPLPLEVHVKLPVVLIAASQRLKSKTVKLTRDWLAQIFGAENAWFADDLQLTYPSAMPGLFARITAGTSLSD